MSNENRRSRVLWWVFAALAAVAAGATVFLYWLLRRPVSLSPSPPPPPSGDDGSCDVSCDAPCQSAIDETCGSVHHCDSGLDCGNGLDCGSNLDCGDNLDCGSGPECNQALFGDAVAHVVANAAWLSMRDRPTLPAQLGIAVIRGYQRLLSRRLGTRCRYTPSCSEYGVVALRLYGALDGAMLALARIKRCTAAVPCGTPDPVIDRSSVARSGSLITAP